MTLDVGQTYEAQLSVTSSTGTPTNPATATLVITLPDQATVTPTITLPPAVTGLLAYDYVFAQPGLHKFAWATTGPGTAKTDYVNVTAFRSAVSLDETREYLGMHDTSKDEMLRSVMAAATKAAERIVGTLIPVTYTDQWVDGTWRSVIRLPGGPLLSAGSVTSISSVYAGGPTWAPAQMIVNPEAGTVRLLSLLPFWYGPWKASYTAGRQVIPDDVIEGVKEIIWDLWATRRWLTPDADEPGLADTATYETLPAGYEVHGRALQLLEGERRPGFA